jgi:hypothetical protein
VIFDDVNINTMIEVELDGRRVPMPHILEATNRMTVQEIHDRFRTAKRRPEATAEQRFMRAFLILPAFVRRIFYAFVMRFPTWSRRFSSSVLVTAVGMFGRGGGWALTMPNFTLTVAVGGIQEKPAVVDGEILIREILNLTVSVDHDIVDGGPIARFVSLFRELLEAGSGLE